ncbi:MAG: mismatch-specific DNA-glycosylase [Alphaproteobacteria bacterium]|nr:mismatch-specific DNA-glycosylase [Alphaproteobacteria bacterium]
MGATRAHDRPGGPWVLGEAGGDILPDVLVAGLAVVFCGSAASRRAAAVGAYCAGAGNLFWPTLHRLGLTERRLAPAEFARVLDYRIGLTDLVKRAFGSDREFPAGADDVPGLRAKIARWRPGYLAFNDKRAAERVLGRPVAYGPQPEALGPSACYVLPSTAGLARGFWDIGPWQELATIVRTLP